MAEQDFPFLSDLRQWGNLKEDLPEGVFFCEIALVWNLGLQGRYYGSQTLCGERNKRVDNCYRCEMFFKFNLETGGQFDEIMREGKLYLHPKGEK